MARVIALACLATMMGCGVAPGFEGAAGALTSDAPVLVASVDVRRSSVDVKAVRIVQGLAAGPAHLGDAAVESDGSWAALIPANVPVHLQLVDRFGMAVVNEPVWISGRRGESLLCGGCHQDRPYTTVVQPGSTRALARGPERFAAPAQTPPLASVVDRKCAGCHTVADVSASIEPGSARTSKLFEKLNPPQLLPYDPTVRFRAGARVHPVDAGGEELTATEYYAFILMADMGGQY